MINRRDKSSGETSRNGYAKNSWVDSDDDLPPRPQDSDNNFGKSCSNGSSGTLNETRLKIF
jgi:hypothetical protein